MITTVIYTKDGLVDEADVHATYQEALEYLLKWPGDLDLLAYDRDKGRDVSFDLRFDVVIARLDEKFAAEDAAATERAEASAIRQGQIAGFVMFGVL